MVHSPSGDVAARYAAMILEHRGTTLADLYEARAVLEPPCARPLAGHCSPGDVAKLRAAAGEAAAGDPMRLLAQRTAFHNLVVELAGSPTLAVLAGMGLRAHQHLVELIEAGDEEGAESLWRGHLVAAEDHVLQGAEQVLDLLD